MPAGKQKLQYEVGKSPSNSVCYFSVFSHTDWLFMRRTCNVPTEMLGGAEGMVFLSVQQTWLQNCTLLQQDRPLIGDISGSLHCHCCR